MSEFNSEPIDIIVPWVNPNDNNWKNDFKTWKEKETGEKADERFRDSGAFPFWFRCIEQNMPWIRYVFLVLASPSQIPSWLNVNHPKLKIVYHDQFIPKKELPTFNSSVINCYMPFIEELSNNYILFNDDMFAIKPTKENDWFVDDEPVMSINIGHKIYDGHWRHNLANGYDIVNEHFHTNVCFEPEHGPIANNKNLNLFAWHKFRDKFTAALKNSKFRQKKNITDWVFFHFACVAKKIKKSRLKTAYNNTCDIRAFLPIVCINDNERIKDKDAFFKATIKFLIKRFPNKSRFEC